MRGRVLGLLLLAGCAPPPAKPSAPRAVVAAPRVAPPLAAPRAIAVARNVDLYEASHGSPFVGHVEHGEVLVWGEDDFVRVRVSNGGKTTELAGYVSPLRDKSAGMGLFVERSTPLLGVDGKEVGTAHRGAYVRIARGDAPLVEVLVGDRRLKVDRAALGTSKLPPPAPPSYERTVSHLDVVVDAGSFRLASRCDETLGVMSAAGKVALFRDGLEIFGTAKEGTRCPPRVAKQDAEASAPPSWVRTKGMRVTAFARARTFWHSSGTTCTKESFTPGSGGGTLQSSSPMPHLFDGMAWTRVATDRVKGVKPLLVEPTVVELEEIAVAFRDAHGRMGRPPGYGEGIALCGHPQTTLVGETADGVLTITDRQDWSNAGAVHPDDIDVWYTSEAACLREVVRRTAEMKGSDPIAALARGPRGC